MKTSEEMAEIKSDSEELLPKLWEKMSDVLERREKKGDKMEKLMECTGKLVDTVQKMAEAIEEKDKKKGEKRETNLLTKPKLLPIWGGEEYELYAGEVHHWNKVSTDSEYSKYHDLREVLKKKKGLEKVMDTIVSRTEADNNKTVRRIMKLLEEKFGKTYAEKVMDFMGEMDRLKNGGEGETEEHRWGMFRILLSEFKILKLHDGGNGDKRNV